MTVQDWLTLPKGQAGLELPAGSTAQLTYTNHFVADTTGAPAAPFDTPNGLVAPGQDIHVSKPISAFQDQFQVRKTVGRHTISAGAYFAYVKHPHRGRKAAEVARRLVDRQNLLALPGSVFGPGQDDYLRVAFANVDAASMPEIAARLAADAADRG